MENTSRLAALFHGPLWVVLAQDPLSTEMGHRALFQNAPRVGGDSIRPSVLCTMSVSRKARAAPRRQSR